MCVCVSNSHFSIPRGAEGPLLSFTTRRRSPQVLSWSDVLPGGTEKRHVWWEWEFWYVWES